MTDYTLLLSAVIFSPYAAENNCELAIACAQ